MNLYPFARYGCNGRLIVLLTAAKQHCEIALARIRQIAEMKLSPGVTMPLPILDLDIMMTIKSEIYEAIEESGLEYFISSVRPGRNRIIYLTDKMIVVNQSSGTLQ